MLFSYINDPLIPKGSVISHKSNAQWDERWARFSQSLLSHVLNKPVIAVKSPLD
jgi:hypothetical protein